jgi:hypothetical protein
MDLQHAALCDFVNLIEADHGIGEAGGRGKCGPNSLAYLLFGNERFGGLIRRILHAILSEDALLIG